MKKMGKLIKIDPEIKKIKIIISGYVRCISMLTIPSEFTKNWRILPNRYSFISAQLISLLECIDKLLLGSSVCVI